MRRIAKLPAGTVENLLKPENRKKLVAILTYHVLPGKVMEADVKQLEERILRDGKVLGGGILKVDSFVNHQVDPLLMDACGKEFAKRFASVGATKILTAEISGIAPAVTTAIHLGLPVVYARKTKPITMPDQVYLTLAPSHTKGRMVELIISPEYLANNEKVLIIDDFLASGQTILGLVRLAEASGDPALQGQAKSSTGTLFWRTPS